MKHLKHIPLIRQLDSADRANLVDHFRKFPPEARRSRFFRVMTDDAIADWVSHIDFSDEALFGLYGFGSELRGVVQASPGFGTRWELAFSVIPDAQRLGIGEALGNRVLEHLRARGAREAWLCCLVDNLAMRRLAQKLGFSLHTECGEVCGRLPLPGPVPQRAAA